MSRNNYHYDAYRGRSRSRTVLAVVVAVLVVLLVLAVAAFFLLQQYMVYTDDGRARLELPFPSAQSQAPAPSDVPPAPSAAGEEIVIVTESPEALPQPTQTPAERLPVTHALWLLRAHLTDGSYRALVQQAGANAVAFNMKADDGSLGYVSSLPQAIRYGSTSTDGTLNDALSRLWDGELYTVARVSCFKDNQAPKVDNTLAMRTTAGYNWRDGGNKRWLNVSSQAARDYVVGVIRELADMGFDEILLENSGYPGEGDLSSLRVGEDYDPQKLTEPVEAFYREVRAALEDTGVRLSIAASETVMTQGSDATGQTLELLDKYADRIYAPRPPQGESWQAADKLVYLEPKDTAFVPGESQLILR